MLSRLLTWSKEQNMIGKKEKVSIIDKDCLVEGTVNVNGKLIVAGSLKGTIAGNTVVTVEGSQVDAKAKVRNMTIGGKFEGEATVYESLRILSTGAFSGNLSCKNITLDAGGKLDGRVRPFDAREEPTGTDALQAAKEVQQPAGSKRDTEDTKRPKSD
jgi:cytoskeletal protein CcmA (bactofilin family)